ncbi:LptF/LptG family permease [Methylocucumis oryzae]|uniref:LptF/LptG family permease n=1 Tax=Methylocucumis oryzae TaxID=1632867 RepID=UPI001EFA053A|nr:LptF/LptG family permease [Methylocucumis oryzae]
MEKITRDKTMHNVFVQNRTHNELAVINANEARLSDTADGVYLIFKHGQRVQGQPGQKNFTVERFNDYAIRIDERSSPASLNRQAIPTEQLWQANNNADSAELQKRIAIPVSLILLSFISVPLAQQSPRSGVYGNILIGFLIYFSYGNFLRLSQVWVANGVISTWLGGITVNAFLIAIGLVLLSRNYGFALPIRFFKRIAP